MKICNVIPEHPICATRISCVAKIYCSTTLKPIFNDNDVVEIFAYKEDSSFLHNVAALVRKQGTTELRWIGVRYLSHNCWLVFPEYTKY